MNIDTRALVVFAVIGILAGFLASILIGGGGGLLRYLVTGIIGAFVGGYLFEALKIDLGIGNKFLSEVVTATVGAVIVVVIARIIA
ncbi:MAG: GlsB/YeaQ/YmgE family stress response membrane protein [Hyphomicrobium sp.]|jgi:uncharacterized membrane protein YeaQ/YmgE (transglycosylase-associated protein family)